MADKRITRSYSEGHTKQIGIEAVSKLLAQTSNENAVAVLERILNYLQDDKVMGDWGILSADVLEDFAWYVVRSETGEG